MVALLLSEGLLPIKYTEDMMVKIATVESVCLNCATEHRPVEGAVCAPKDSVRTALLNR